MKTMTISDARTNLPTLIDEVNGAAQEVVGIMRHGKPVAHLISSRMYESLVETLEILSDASLTEKLLRALKDAGKAKLIPLAKIKKELGIED
jgi:prevent-host-death family protein